MATLTQLQERFELLRRLGEGGMGIVYEVYDRQRELRVALKQIKGDDSDRLYRFKNEFRSLSDVVHPNLVTLYDLVGEQSGLAFTMELIEGVDLRTYCGGQPRAERPADDEETVDSSDRIEVDEARLRACLVQLAKGLDALHGHGKLHRDIKFSNVLVEHGGRVVVVDFGLVRDFADDAEATGSQVMVGTPKYMSPEQADPSQPLTPASDWYSVGVMLFEMLTGRPPFVGPSLTVLMEKQRTPAPPPSRLRRGVPADLDHLCRRLLAIDPCDRPTAKEVIALLGGQPKVPIDVATPSHHTTSVPLTGRDPELARLGAAFEAATAGAGGCVVVRGMSGIGKSTLCRAFLDRIRAADAVVLTGKSYEQEFIQFKAIDGVVDALSSYLRGLDRLDAAGLMPRRPEALARLFPVLGRVPAIADAPMRDQSNDPQVQRAHAYDAFRELLHRLADRRRVLLYIDDAQWMDEDTAQLLAQVFAPPDPPRVLLLLAARPPAEGATSDPIAAIEASIGVPTHHLEVAPLAQREAALLAAHLLPDLDEERRRSLVAESGGSPFFLEELARYVQSSSASEPGPVVQLDGVLWRRVERLEADARRLLELLAVAGQPVARRILRDASDLDSDTFTRELRALRAGSFLGAVGRRPDDEVALYHDRLREALAAGLDEERRRAHHRALAVALTGIGAEDGLLARHWLGAGDRERASGHALAAAQAARAQLDFARAVRFYRLALSLAMVDVERLRALRIDLASALSLAGRPEEAAHEFGAAAEGADSATRLDLRRRAAEQLLRGGYLDQGLEAIAQVLAEIGEAFTRTPTRAFLSAALHRARLRLRGTSWTPRDPSTVPPRELTRVDTYWSVAAGLAIVDNIRGADYQARHALHALRLGEPRRVARSLAVEAGYAAGFGNQPRALHFASMAEKLAMEAGDTYALGLAHWGAGAVRYYVDNDWRGSLELFERARTLWIENHQAAGWETNTAELYAGFSLLYLGDLPALRSRVGELIRNANQRGDRYAEVNLRSRLETSWLAEDDPDRGQAELDDTMRLWVPSEPRYLIQHFFALHSAAELALYAGRPVEALERVEREWRPLDQSFLLKVPMVRVEMLLLRARAALASSLDAPSGDARAARWLGQARRMARRLSADRTPLGAQHGRLIEGLVALGSGKPERALPLLEQAAEAYEASSTTLYAAVARYRCGALRGGDAGARERAEAMARLRALGIANPERFAQMIGPAREA